MAVRPLEADCGLFWILGTLMRRVHDSLPSYLILKDFGFHETEECLGVHPTHSSNS